jgi:hydrogenase maturation protease
MKAARAGPRVRVVVCGNVDRGDDGVALAAVASLLPTLPRTLLGRLEVRRRLELRVEDLVDVPEDVSCLILDAVAGIEPGTVVRMTLEDLERRPAFTPRSSHQLPIDLVVGLASILREGPLGGTFVGLAGHGFGYGRALSEIARAAMPAYRAAIESELDELTRGVPFHAPARAVGA